MAPDCGVSSAWESDGRRRGQALVTALIFSVLSVAFLIVAIQFTTNSLKAGRRSQSEIQVYDVALAGIHNAVTWLQKQPVQPVTCFDPKANQGQPDLEADTIASDEQLGLTNNFPVDASRNLEGRYEVGRSTTGPIAAPTRAGVTQTGSHPPGYLTGYPSTITWTAEDISAQRGYATPGLVWLVRSRGYLYDSSKPFSLSSPKPIRTMTLQAEIRRRAFTAYTSAVYCYMPDSGAYIARRPSPDDPLAWLDQWVAPPAFAKGKSTATYFFTVANSGSAAANTVLGVQDGTARVFWTDFSGSTMPVTGGKFSWATATGKGKGATTYNDFTLNDGPLGDLAGCSSAGSASYVNPSEGAQLNAVFGSPSLPTIKAMADAVYSSQDSIPASLPSMSFTYLDCSATFDGNTGANKPNLSGGGVLFVDGDLTINGSSTPQAWNGLIFVTGNYTQQDTSTVQGAVICGGNFTIQGDDSKPATLNYSQQQLDQANTQLGKYQLDDATLRAVPDASAPTY